LGFLNLARAAEDLYNRHVSRLRAGVIGTGSMGRNHVRVLAECPDVDLIGIADPDTEKTDELASRFGCDRFEDYRALIERGLDLAIVSVPTSMHHIVAMDVIDSGSHVFVEKPIADTIEHAYEITRRANNAGKKVFVGHIERFNPAVESAKRVLENGDCGEILCVSNLRVGKRNVRILDTGIILDLGTHDIDLISYLLGMQATSVFCVAKKNERGFEDSASLMLEFPGGKSGIIETSWQMPYKVRKIFVTGEEGFLLVDLIEVKVALLHEKFVAEVPTVKEEPLVRQLNSAIACIREDKAPVVDGVASTYTLSTALAAIESYNERRTIEIMPFQMARAL